MPLGLGPSKMHRSHQAEWEEGFLGRGSSVSKGLEVGNLEGGRKQSIPRGLVYRVCGAKKEALLCPRGPFLPSSVSQLPLSTSALLSLSAFRSVSSIILEASGGQGPYPVHLCVLVL